MTWHLVGGSTVRAPRCLARLALVPAVVAAVLAAVLMAGTLSALSTATPAAAAEPRGVWPLVPVPEVVRGFEPPELRWESGHRGVDLAGRVGQPVRAALPGTVTFAGHVAGRAVVVVDHGATRTTYQPVSASVRRGEDVARGQVIGSLAWFGTHCLPAACLHWGLLAGETYLDPLSLVGGPLPVRLLPLAGPPLLGPSPARRPAVLTLRSSAVRLRTAPVALVALAGAAVATGPR